MSASANTMPEQPQLKVNYVITKHANFTTKHSPTEFRQWKPDVKVDMEINTRQSGAETHEVSLVMKVTVKSEEQEAFVIDLEELGGFTLHALTEDQQKAALNTICSSMIYPYVSEAVASMAVRGGFPALTLAPINFDVIYALRKEKEAEKEAQQQSEEAAKQILH
jgi:preprotein translocase subunit SecB